MKFAVAVVMLALAVGVQSSVVAGHWGGPWGGAWNGAWNGAWGGAWDGAWGAGHHGPAAVAVHASGPWGHGAGPWGHAAGWGGYPGISLSQGPGHAAVAAPLAYGHGHEGVYVAKTRGAVHTAPLAGHISSASSINVAPAPGTH